ncbi:hypothetical protein BDV33DRAFT_168152 [Aspergillus novoparasiticus]|uniref:Uncharacterized protein n=1 Tax=Aspergillus novoparasiticus TaxID=986946 RepID=A0A5N6EZJ7_9EURO|nr:hypothetical protein BDV33DRAFT_168152 [Aspergillus novoparasiticus]
MGVRARRTTFPGQAARHPRNVLILVFDISLPLEKQLEKALKQEIARYRRVRPDNIVIVVTISDRTKHKPSDDTGIAYPEDC